MSKRVQKNKNSVNIGVAIFTAIVSIIPVIIVALTGFSHLKSPYGVYALATFGMCIYFSCIFAMFAWKNKILYIVLDIITVLGILGFMVYAYCNAYNPSGGLMLHIATAAVFTLSFYQTADADQGDGFIFRYIVPVVIDLSGLVFVLWFVSVNVFPIVHIIIVSVINFFALAIFLIPSLVKMIFNREEFFEKLTDDEVEYEEETEEEIKAKKEEKALAAAKARQTSYEKTKNNITKPVQKSNGVTRWFIPSKQIDYIVQDVVHQYNNVVDQLNKEIRENNRIIKNNYYQYDLKKAADSNKSVKKCLKYIKSREKTILKNLVKLRKIEFTTKDMYKSFEYSMLTGKMKSKKSSEDWPTLRVIGCRVYHSYRTCMGYEEKVEMNIDSDNIYLNH